MATALSLAKDAAGIIGVEPPESLQGNTSADARTMLAYLNMTGRDLAIMKNAFSEGWTVLQGDHSFQTVPGQEEYPFPAGFDRLIDGTVWDRNEYREARGVLTAQEWALVKGGLIETISISPFYRIRRASGGRGRAFFLDPVPSETKTLVFEYVSSHWAMNSDGTATNDRLVADTDESLFDDTLMEYGLIWQFKETRGLPFAADLAKYESRRDMLFGQDSGERPLNVGRRQRRGLFPLNTGDTNFGLTR